ncbi:hypothetical protein [Saprospira grandis]|uniref:hypothetical protein n=1 Tax=Saprospira grandis TaxID=1008 RepID=UPI0022DE90BB|nr:hypothetical protein [Saprospira grandis]WBM74723.1 hypothetical protein OP864_00505 [Saprospira grandis]
MKYFLFVIVLLLAACHSQKPLPGQYVETGSNPVVSISIDEKDSFSYEFKGGLSHYEVKGKLLKVKGGYRFDYEAKVPILIRQEPASANDSLSLTVVGAAAELFGLNAFDIRNEKGVFYAKAVNETTINELDFAHLSHRLTFAKDSVPLQLIISFRSWEAPIIIRREDWKEQDVVLELYEGPIIRLRLLKVSRSAKRMRIEWSINNTPAHKSELEIRPSY